MQMGQIRDLHQGPAKNGQRFRISHRCHWRCFIPGVCDTRWIGFRSENDLRAIARGAITALCSE
jgi:hypothetical protein